MIGYTYWGAATEAVRQGQANGTAAGWAFRLETLPATPARATGIPARTRSTKSSDRPARKTENSWFARPPRHNHYDGNGARGNSELVDTSVI